MTVYNVDTVAQLSSAWDSAVGGDEIVVSGGVKTGGLVKSNKSFTGGGLVIRAANPNNPPIFSTVGNSGERWDFQNIRYVTFEGLNWRGSGNSTGTDGGQYPRNGSIGVRITGQANSNIIFNNCTWDWYDFLLDFAGSESGSKVSWCTFTRWGVDAIRMFRHHNGTIKEHLLLHNPRVDGGNTSGGRHPDLDQMACNNTDSPSVNMIIRNNIYRGWAGYMQGIFTGNARSREPSSGTSNNWQNFLIENCFIEVGHAHGIYLEAHTNLTLKNCLIRKIANTPNTGLYTPTISVGGPKNSGVIQNCVMPRAIALYSTSDGLAGSTANLSISGINISSSAVPSGWTMPLAGAYGDDSEEPPAPTPPPALTAGQWNVPSGVAKSYTIEGQTFYSPILMVFAGSQANGLAPEQIRWIGGGAGTWKPVEAATPAINPDTGAYRYNLLSGPFGGTFHLSPPSGTINVRVQYQDPSTGLWSEFSDQKIWAAPAESSPPPEPDHPDGLGNTDWRIVEVVEAPHLLGRFTATVALTTTSPVGDEDVTGMAWSFGDGVLRPLSAVDTDENGITVYRLSPLQENGTEHSALFEESFPNFHLHYFVEDVASENGTAKSFTAPEAPEEVKFVTLGQTVWAVPSGVTGSSPLTYTYEWRLNGVAIPGETSESYTTDTVGNLTVRIRVKNPAGIDSSVSSPVMVVTP